MLSQASSYHVEAIVSHVTDQTSRYVTLFKYQYFLEEWLQKLFFVLTVQLASLRFTTRYFYK